MYKLKSAFQSFATKAIAVSGVITASCMTLSAQSAQALLPINFSTTDFNITQGAGNNNAAAGIPIDQNTPPNGFGDVFDQTFILLGANVTDGNIPLDSLNNNNSIAVSNTFELDATDVSQVLEIEYNWAFNGNSTGGAGDQDNFSIALFSQSQSVFETIVQQNAGAGYGFQNDATSSIAANTIADATDYRLVITLNENADFFGRSSAAGFNQITLSNPSTPPPPGVPFGFSTNASLVVFGAAFYGVNRLRKKMAAKKFQA